MKTIDFGWSLWRAQYAYQWVFEKGDLRIGVMIVDGRISISDPPAGE